MVSDVFFEELLDVAGVLFAEVPVFGGGFVTDIKGVLRRGGFEAPVLEWGIDTRVETEEDAIFFAVRRADRFDKSTADEV